MIRRKIPVAFPRTTGFPFRARDLRNGLPFGPHRKAPLGQGLLVLLAFAAPFAAAQERSELQITRSSSVQNKFTRVESGVPPRSDTSGKIVSLGDHYLMVVAGNRASSLTTSQLNLLNQSAYDGIAVRFVDAYNPAQIPSAEDMTAKLLDLKKSSIKDLWPWVSINRMVGRDPEIDNPSGRETYFTRFHGLDLDGLAGAQDDFVLLWQNSLRTAKQTHAPGIVADPEFYLNNKAYDPTLLAKQIGRSVDDTLALLHKLGVRLADAAAKEYPNAVIWFMFTDLGQYGWKVDGNVKYYPTPAYIVMGMLDQIRHKHYALKLISGGEIAIGYCSFSVQHLQHKIDVRAQDFAQHRKNYGESLVLAGTIILWSDRDSMKGFMNADPCAKSDAKTVEDQQPYLELLFKTYRYNWIYATSYSGYDPINPAVANRFTSVIKKAKAKVAAISAN